MKNLKMKMKSIATFLRHTTFAILGVAAIILACTAFPEKVQAAVPYESHTFSYWNNTLHHELGGKYFWFDTSLKVSSSLSGTKTTIYTPKYGESLQGCVVSNGSYVLYAVQKNGSSNVTIYTTNLKTNKRKVYCTYKSSYGFFAGYYDRKIYLKKPVLEDGMDFGRSKIVIYNYKSKKYNTLLDSVGFFQQYGSYFGWSHPQSDPSPKNLFVYNASTRKSTLISKYANTRAIVNGTLYYVEWNGYVGTTGVLKSCKLNGSSKKTIATFKNTVPGAVSAAYGPEYAVVRTSDTYTRVYYRNGKKKPSNFYELERVLYGY